MFEILIVYQKVNNGFGASSFSLKYKNIKQWDQLDPDSHTWIDSWKRI